VLHRLCGVLAAVIPAVVLGALTGCAASSAAAPGPVIAASANDAAISVVVAERDNGKVVRVTRGSTVTVVLHSTYWRFGPLPGRSVLAQLAAPGLSPRPPGAGGCVPGQGCGTVTVAYWAAGTGTSAVRASRSTCGEALRCTGGHGRFTVTIVVKP
jgi:hypothetical protein